MLLETHRGVAGRVERRKMSRSYVVPEFLYETSSDKLEVRDMSGGVSVRAAGCGNTSWMYICQYFIACMYACKYV